MAFQAHFYQLSRPLHPSGASEVRNGQPRRPFPGSLDDRDVATILPDLISLVGIPPPRDQVLARFNACWHLHSIDDVRVHHLVVTCTRHVVRRVSQLLHLGIAAWCIAPQPRAPQRAQPRDWFRELPLVFGAVGWEAVVSAARNAILLSPPRLVDP